MTMNALVGNEVKAVGDGVEGKQSVYGRMAPCAGSVALKKVWMTRSGLPIADVGIKSPLLYQLS